MSYNLRNLSQGNFQPAPPISFSSVKRKAKQRPHLCDMTFPQQINEIKNGRLTPPELKAVLSNLLNSNTDSSEKKKIEDALKEYTEVLEARDEFPSSKITTALAQSSRLTIRQWVLTQANLSDNTLNILAQDPIVDIKEAVARRANLSDDTLNILAQDNNPNVIQALGSNTNLCRNRRIGLVGLENVGGEEEEITSSESELENVGGEEEEITSSESESDSDSDHN